MDVSLSSWFVLLLAVSAANAPFFSERMFALIPATAFGSAVKPFWLRLIELGVLYALVLGIAHLLESRIGNVFPQRWEFYAITVCLFLVLAFPGFVFRYLRRHHD